MPAWSWLIWTGAYLIGANLCQASLRGACLADANLADANLAGANLIGAHLGKANLLSQLERATLAGAILICAHLDEANLTDVRGLTKVMGVMPGNCYWKRFKEGLCGRGYRLRVGMNRLREREVFANDERALYSCPGFQFGTRSWCAVRYPDWPLEALIRIPEDARINEPWATDGHASADKIEILRVFDVATGEDVTEKYRRSNTDDRT
jgi:hypothetical protein